MKHLVKHKTKKIPTKAVDAFVTKVVEFYKENGRHDLPWRKRTTPYIILVSEVMLQQTQVSRVTPKFLLWKKKYPTLTALSKASFKEVLTLWQGLGYQRRVKSLYAIAGLTKVLPRTFEKLLTLPGIGTYTASAVCAFAYNTFSHPLLETNIRTALIEYFYTNEQQIFDSLLIETLLQIEKNNGVQSMGAREWYYALMDYGAYLKSQGISHNNKTVLFRKQTAFKGSLRALRAETLFAILHEKPLPIDSRIEHVLSQLESESFITRERGGYVIV